MCLNLLFIEDEYGLKMESTRRKDKTARLKTQGVLTDKLESMVRDLQIKRKGTKFGETIRTCFYLYCLS